jgi:serine phosphatase RsbU (regulator of sigma subunit)
MKKGKPLVIFVITAIVLWLCPALCLADDSKADSLVHTIRNTKEDTNKANSIHAVINQLIDIGNYHKSDSLARIELELSQKLNYKRGIANAYNSFGIASSYQGDYSRSLEYLVKAQKIYDEINDKRGMAIAMKYIGTAYQEEGDSTEAITNLHKALHIFIELKDTDYIATSLLSVGNLYEAEGNHSAALAHMNKALELYKKINEKDGIASSLMYIGSTYLAKVDYVQALDYLTLAINMFSDLGDKAGMSTCYVSIGNAFMELGKYKDALDYENSGLEIAKAINSLEDVQHAENTLSNIYGKMGDGKKALQHYKAYIVVRDSAFNLERTQKATREEMNFDFEKKQAEENAAFEKKQAAEKAAQDKKDALEQAEVRKKGLIIYFGAGIMLLVLGFAIYAYRSNILRKRANKIIAGKNYQITESINYAQRIQHAMLPADEDVQRVFPLSFILFRPKDIVSGDFYFFHKNKEKAFLAVADCTGHGIPGAFMSMICSEKLNDAVQADRKPGDILKVMNKGLKRSLHQSDNDDSTHDGMDIALCSITTQPNGVNLNYSGANRPLWVIRKGKAEIEEIEPTKKAIGAFTSDEQEYTTNEVQLKQGDSFYMFTDGYTDQFGGASGKKLTIAKFKEFLLSIKEKHMEEQKNELISFMESWKGDHNQPDDILVIGVRV